MKPGRPKKDVIKKMVSIRLHPDVIKALKEAAARQEIPVTTLIERAIDKIPACNP